MQCTSVSRDPLDQIRSIVIHVSSLASGHSGPVNNQSQRVACPSPAGRATRPGSSVRYGIWFAGSLSPLITRHEDQHVHVPARTKGQIVELGLRNFAVRYGTADEWTRVDLTQLDLTLFLLSSAISPTRMGASHCRCLCRRLCRAGEEGMRIGYADTSRALPPSGPPF